MAWGRMLLNCQNPFFKHLTPPSELITIYRDLWFLCKMASTAPLFHYSPRFIDHRITNSNNKNNLSSSSTSCSSSTSSFDNLRGNNWNINTFSGNFLYSFSFPLINCFLFRNYWS